MVINNFNIKHVSAIPNKDYSPLVINSDAIKILESTAKFFKTVGWRDPKVGYVLGVVKHS